MPLISDTRIKIRKGSIRAGRWTVSGVAPHVDLAPPVIRPASRPPEIQAQLPESPIDAHVGDEGRRPTIL